MKFPEYLWPLLLSIVIGFAGKFIVGISPLQVFVLMVIAFVVSGTLLIWRLRLAFSLIGTSLLMMIGVLNIDTLLEYGNMNVLLFLVGIMIIVTYLEEEEFFTKITIYILKFVGEDGFKLYLVFTVLSFILSGLIDGIAVAIFMTVLAIEITSVYEVEPFPLILSSTFGVVLGGGSTIMGDLASIIVAFEGGFSMNDFLIWSTPLMLLSLMILILSIKIVYKNDILILSQRMKEYGLEKVIKELSKDMETGIFIPATIFFFLILLILLTPQLSILLSYFTGLNIDYHDMYVAVAMFIGGIVLAIKSENAPVIVHKVDWWTLLFFFSFFASVGSLHTSGLTTYIIDSLMKLSGGNLYTIYFVTVAFSTLLTPFINNVLTVASLTPIIKSMEILGINIFPLWWGLLISSFLVAPLSPVGSTTSIIVISSIERRKLMKIPYRKWLRLALPLVIPAFIISLTILTIRLFML